jgi:hypothetical protein
MNFLGGPLASSVLTYRMAQLLEATTVSNFANFYDYNTENYE